MIALTVACGPASAALLSVQGVARDPASGRLLYREDHLVKRDGTAPRERLVLYRCPDGQAFARKRVDYSPSATAPSFSLTDARDGYREGLKRDGSSTEVWSGKTSSALDKVDGALVADAGFDQFLRGHWDDLLANGSLPLSFVVPSLGRSLGFRIQSTGTDTIAGEAMQTFRLRVRGLLGIVAPDIDVAYRASGDHDLRRFTGLSNIRDNAGKPLTARIDFAKPPATADAAQWQAALDAPLAACNVGG